MGGTTMYICETMYFCGDCNLAMQCVTSTGVVEFWCMRCNVKKEGEPGDARIFGATLSRGAHTREMSKPLIAMAGRDRVNQLVSRPCPNCGSDYMALVRIGDAEVVIYRCKCGYMTGAGDAPEGSPG